MSSSAAGVSPLNRGTFESCSILSGTITGPRRITDTSAEGRAERWSAREAHLDRSERRGDRIALAIQAGLVAQTQRVDARGATEAVTRILDDLDRERATVGTHGDHQHDLGVIDLLDIG